MSNTIFISNRLPLSVELENDKLKFTESLGGLATGLKSIHSIGESLWAGWPGIADEQLTDEHKKEIDRELKARNYVPVHMSSDDIEQFYYGFCNQTIWPLFHYFTSHAHYKQSLWENYRKINELFFDRISPHIKKDDQIWVHDYQLMLLPRMIKKRFPDVEVGFFLHIPFPSYEIFRLLPWREDILRGLLGADLIGFHTYDYVRHFLSSIRRLLGHEHNLGRIQLGNRIVQTDVFPMGIDYDKFAGAGRIQNVKDEVEQIVRETSGKQIVLSVDRLDYTKGIPERIKAFNYFLEQNPDYHGKITLILIAAPSRTEVESYASLKREIEELVSQVNGLHGTIGWVPIWFFYRSFSFENLNALYSISDILLVTPLRDGMNLISKEYIAARTDKKGVIVLSETAGAACELGESLIINPNNIREIAQALKEALEMPVVQQIARNEIMHERIKRYDVKYWANDFMEKLAQVKLQQQKFSFRHLDDDAKGEIQIAYAAAKRRLLLLDYDGTLKSFCNHPAHAVPEPFLLELLASLCADKRNHVVIISGRDRRTLSEWFSLVDANLIAGHGIWAKDAGGEWETMLSLDNSWKEVIRPVLELHADRTPGSIVEEKDYSLAWHYRRCEPELASVRLRELRETLLEYTQNLEIGLLDGNKVLEVKNKSVNKGRAAGLWLEREKWDFILAAGDDLTDEDMFQVLPEKAFSIKVGFDHSQARYHAKSADKIIELLKDLAANSC